MNRLGDGAGNSNAPDISDTKIKIFMILKLKIKEIYSLWLNDFAEVVWVWVQVYVENLVLKSHLNLRNNVSGVKYFTLLVILVM